MAKRETKMEMKNCFFAVFSLLNVWANFSAAKQREKKK
jgi:hypothetical protein